MELRIHYIFSYSIVILLVGLLFSMLILAIYKNNYAPEIPCLEEIAENCCEEEGLYFEEVSWFAGWKFYCSSNLRKSESDQFDFFEEEIKDCKGVNKK